MNSKKISEGDKPKYIAELFDQFSIVMLVKGKQADIGGNAIVIAPGIAITCAHVPLLNNFHSFKDIKEYPGAETYFHEESLNLVVTSKKYNAKFIINIVRGVKILGTDLAVLYLKDQTGLLPKDIWNEITIKILPPKIDDEVFTIGSVFQNKITDIINGQLPFEPEYVASFGSVIDHKFQIPHPQSGPGFYLAAAVPDTLSGSPVFNSRKELVGLVSRGDNSSNPATFVSVLYPLFSNSYYHQNVNDYHLYKLAKSRAISCKGLYRIRLRKKSRAMITFPKYLKEF